MKLSSSQYAQALYQLTKNKPENEVNVVIEKFVNNLRQNGLTGKVNEIIKKFIEIYNKENGILQAKIITVRELNEEMIEKIKDNLRRKYQAEKIELETMVDEKLKGGIKIIVGEDILDGSIAGRLAKLKNSLVG